MPGRKKIIIASIILIIAVSSISCITFPVGITSSTAPLSEKAAVQNLGKVRGTHTTWALFGLLMIGRPDIDMAISDALKQKGGEALINVRCYEEISWFLLFSLNRVIVEGEAISSQVKQK